MVAITAGSSGCPLLAQVSLDAGAGTNPRGDVVLQDSQIVARAASGGEQVTLHSGTTYASARGITWVLLAFDGKTITASILGPTAQTILGSATATFLAGTSDARTEAVTTTDWKASVSAPVDFECISAPLPIGSSANLTDGTVRFVLHNLAYTPASSACSWNAQILFSDSAGMSVGALIFVAPDTIRWTRSNSLAPITSVTLSSPASLSTPLWATLSGGTCSIGSGTQTLASFAAPMTSTPTIASAPTVGACQSAVGTVLSPQTQTQAQVSGSTHVTLRTDVSLPSPGSIARELIAKWWHDHWRWVVAALVVILAIVGLGSLARSL